MTPEQFTHIADLLYAIGHALRALFYIGAVALVAFMFGLNAIRLHESK